MQLVRRFFSRWLSRWDDITIPTRFRDMSTSRDRDRSRRALLISRVDLLFLVLDFISTPFTFFIDPVLWFHTTLIGAIIFLASLLLNKRGLVTVAGCICVAGSTFTTLIPLASGTDLSGLPLLSLLIIPLIITCAALPPAAVFVQLGVNLACISVVLFSPLNDPSIVAFVQGNTYVAFVPQVALQVESAVIIYIVVQNLKQAMQRADQAEEHARFQSAMARQEHALAEQKTQLDGLIQLVLTMCLRATKNDYSPLSPSHDPIQGPLVASLNTLLARFERLHQDAQAYQSIQTTAALLATALRHARQEHQLLHVKPNGTVLDPLIQELLFSEFPSLNGQSSPSGKTPPEPLS